MSDTAVAHLEGGGRLANRPKDGPDMAMGLSPRQHYDILLDQSRTIQTTPCPVPVGEARSRKTGKWVKLPCGKWGCESCGPAKTKKLKIRTALGDLSPAWFLTLTLQVEDPKPIMDSFNLWISGLRKDGYVVRYFLVKEFTVRGKRHLHILGEGWIPYIELSRRWERATGGCSKWCHVRPVHNKGHGVNYAMKYMGKMRDSTLFERGERRYSASRGVLWPAWKSADEWDVFVYRTNHGTTAARCYDDYGRWVKRSLGEFEKSLGPPPPYDQLGLSQCMPT